MSIPRHRAVAPGSPAPERRHGQLGRLNLSLLLGSGNNIGRQLIVLVVTFSSIITLIISAIQLFDEYSGLRSDLDIQLDQVAINLPSIAGSVWAFDDRQINLALKALTQQPNIERAAIQTGDKGRRWMAGQTVSSRLVSRSYSLRHMVRGEEVEIAKLEITAGLGGIYKRVADHAITIILSNGLKTFLVVIFMVAIIRRLITDRLDQMAKSVGELFPPPAHTGSTAAKGVESPPRDLDELDRVNWVIEDAAQKMGISVDAMRHLNDELEKRIDERTRELENLNKELEAFSYTLSHDLRAPLRGIVGFAHVLEEDAGEKLDQEDKENLTRITRASHRMETLIDDTLSLFRVTAAPLARQPVDVAAMSREIADQFVAAEPGRQVSWTIDSPLTAEADPGLLRSALENLIGNAWKYSSRRAAAAIELGAEIDAAGRAVFFIRDNGAGFDMRYADKLFVPFQRLHRETEFPGTGIGLAAVQKIVRRHGGEIWAESVPDQGATFRFTLA